MTRNFILQALTIIIGFVLFAYLSPSCSAEEVKELVPESICPITKIYDNSKCMSCHEVRKEDDKFVWTVEDKRWRHLPFKLKIVQRGGKDVGLYEMHSGIDSDYLLDVYEYLHDREIGHLIIDIDSHGGSLTEGWRCVALMNQFDNITTTTRVYGYAASAAALVLSGGTPGYRLASPTAMIMFHQLSTLSWLKVETPAMSKDEAEIMELWQTNVDEWLSGVSKAPIELIKEKTHKADWWMTGREAEKWGFVDKLLWQPKGE